MLERLRSLHTEREACALFAWSILDHPLRGSNARGGDGGGTVDNDYNDGNNDDDDGCLPPRLPPLGHP
jgi:hypothetical protein